MNEIMCVCATTNRKCVKNEKFNENCQMDGFYLFAVHTANTSAVATSDTDKYVPRY